MNFPMKGAPISNSTPSWLKARSVVAGRLVNCYASNDWLLALLYRSKSYDLSVAGLSPVHIQKNTSISSYVLHQQQQEEQCNNESVFHGVNETVGLFLSLRNDVENVDVSEFIHSHSDYPKALSTIFEILRL